MKERGRGIGRRRGEFVQETERTGEILEEKGGTIFAFGREWFCETAVEN